jgi:hypothetical protein
LLATREHELTRAVTAGEGPILEHALPVLLVRPIAPVSRRGPPSRVGRSVDTNRRARTDGSIRARSRNYVAKDSGVVKRFWTKNLVRMAPQNHEIRSVEATGT